MAVCLSIHVNVFIKDEKVIRVLSDNILCEFLHFFYKLVGYTL